MLITTEFISLDIQEIIVVSQSLTRLQEENKFKKERNILISD